jgi:diguanylate cyclase (GGDEF)-like protein
VAWRNVRLKTGDQRRERRHQAAVALTINDRSAAAYRDELTGLGNRFRFEEDLIDVESKITEPWVLILGDVAGLKALNDSRTHETGDVLLCVVGQGMRKALRDTDRIYRLGGDEFATIIPMASLENMSRVLDRLRTAIAAEARRAPQLAGFEVHVRFGWASTLEGAADLYTRADATLTARHERETKGIVVDEH